MTVCVAAVFDHQNILGASDRMVSGPDVQFEPESPKIVPLTNSIVALTAGDSALHAEIINLTYTEVNNRIAASEADNAPRWLDVREVADIYRHYHSQLLRREAENRILVPLALTSDSFITRQQELNSQLAQQLARELIDYPYTYGPSFEAIIAGVDSTGPHLYRLDRQQITCHDRVGFVSIGIGSRHVAAPKWRSCLNFRYPVHSGTLPGRERQRDGSAAGSHGIFFFEEGGGAADRPGNAPEQAPRTP